MEIHQILVSASPGDAITNAALEVRSVLRQVGPSDIFARYFDPRLVDEVQPLARYDRRGSGRPEEDLLIFHASIGEPQVLRFVLDRPERIILLYHNISPSAPFLPYDPAFSGLLEGGRRELSLLRQRTVMALAVSAFNAAELVSLGFRNVRVSPLVVDVERLKREPSDPTTAHHLETMVEGPVLLFVGQLLPHKRPDFLIKTFHVLATHLRPEAHLILVGASRLPQFHAVLQHFISELNLPNAWITGAVSLSQLATFYRRADVFFTASEHEGFCVPLLEAMAFDVPVVARACAAVPETLGGAGLLLPAEEDPLLAAEAIEAVLSDDGLRGGLVAAGHRRLVHFDPDRARAALLTNLLELV
jgi:glycosyltransferase involved in cell wall biosynthesis